jgi:hypothetical protein
MGTQGQRLGATIIAMMAPGYLWWFSRFISMKENDHKNQGAFTIYFREGKRREIQALTSRTTPTRQLPTSWQPSRIVLGSHFPCMC